MPRGKVPTRRKPRPEREVNAAREHHTPTGKSFCTSQIWVVRPSTASFVVQHRKADSSRQKKALGMTKGRNKLRPKYAIPQFVRLRRRAGGWPVLQTVTELSSGGSSGGIIANYLAQS